MDFNRAKHNALAGTMLAIDPSSCSRSGRGISEGGWAEFKEGYLISSGVIHMPHITNAHTRMRELKKCLDRDFTARYDYMIIEGLSPMFAPKTLVQATGIYIASIRCSFSEEIVPRAWRAIADRINELAGEALWFKDDEMDARFIGWSAICKAMGYKPKNSANDSIILEVIERIRKFNNA